MKITALRALFQMSVSSAANYNVLKHAEAVAVAEQDCIKILLATDNHIGYMERDPIRGQEELVK